MKSFKEILLEINKLSDLELYLDIDSLKLTINCYAAFTDEEDNEYGSNEIEIVCENIENLDNTIYIYLRGAELNNNIIFEKDKTGNIKKIKKGVLPLELLKYLPLNFIGKLKNMTIEEVSRINEKKYKRDLIESFVNTLEDILKSEYDEDISVDY